MRVDDKLKEAPGQRVSQPNPQSAAAMGKYRDALGNPIGIPPKYDDPRREVVAPPKWSIRVPPRQKRDPLYEALDMMELAAEASREELPVIARGAKEDAILSGKRSADRQAKEQAEWDASQQDNAGTNVLGNPRDIVRGIVIGPYNTVRNYLSPPKETAETKAAGDAYLQERFQKRQAFNEATPKLQKIAKDVVYNITDHKQALEQWRSLHPQEQDELITLLDGAAQMLGDSENRDSGPYALVKGVNQGFRETFQHPVERFLGTDSNSEREAAFLQLASGVRDAEAGVVQPQDPMVWQGVGGASKQLPFMATTAGGAGVGRWTFTKALGAMFGRQAAPQTAKQIATMAAAGRAGELTGTAFAGLPVMYDGAVQDLKAAGMTDGPKLHTLAAISGLVGSLLEGLIPNPWSIPGVKLRRGVMNQTRQITEGAIKNYGAQLNEEGWQSFSSSIGTNIAQYLDENVKESGLGDAFRSYWEGVAESALPMLFTIGAPAMVRAAASAPKSMSETAKIKKIAADLTPEQVAENQARWGQLLKIREKKFVSEQEAKDLKIGKPGKAGKNRKGRMADLDAEIERLEDILYWRAKNETESQRPGDAPPEFNSGDLEEEIVDPATNQATAPPVSPPDGVDPDTGIPLSETGDLSDDLPESQASPWTQSQIDWANSVLQEASKASKQGVVILSGSDAAKDIDLANQILGATVPADPAVADATSEEATAPLVPPTPQDQQPAPQGVPDEVRQQNDEQANGQAAPIVAEAQGQQAPQEGGVPAQEEVAPTEETPPVPAAVSPAMAQAEKEARDLIGKAAAALNEELSDPSRENIAKAAAAEKAAQEARDKWRALKAAEAKAAATAQPEVAATKPQVVTPSSPPVATPATPASPAPAAQPSPAAASDVATPVAESQPYEPTEDEIETKRKTLFSQPASSNDTKRYQVQRDKARSHLVGEKHVVDGVSDIEKEMLAGQFEDGDTVAMVGNLSGAFTVGNGRLVNQDGRSIAGGSIGQKAWEMYTSTLGASGVPSNITQKFLDNLWKPKGRTQVVRIGKMQNGDFVENPEATARVRAALEQAFRLSQSKPSTEAKKPAATPTNAPPVVKSAQSAPPVAPTPQAPPQVEQKTPAPADKQSVEFPVASDVVDGRTVRTGPVPNMDSIDAELSGTEYEVLPGVREIPMSAFPGLTGKHYSVNGDKKIGKLQEAIAQSNEITPLIVVVDDNGPYILEGATRSDALFNLGAKSFPAVVVDARSRKEATEAKSPVAEVATPVVEKSAPKQKKKAEPVAKVESEAKPEAKPKPAKKAEQSEKSAEEAWFDDLEEEQWLDLEAIAKEQGVTSTDRGQIAKELLANPDIKASIQEFLKVESEEQKEKGRRKTKTKPPAKVKPNPKSQKRPKPAASNSVPKGLRSPGVEIVSSNEFLPAEKRQEKILGKMGVSLRVIVGGNQSLPGFFEPRTMTIWLNREYIQRWNNLWEKQGRPAESMTWGLFSHEAFHAMRESNPEVWQKLYDWVETYDKQGLEKAGNDYFNDLKSQLGKSGAQADEEINRSIKNLADPGVWANESLSRYLEDRAGDFKFWKDMEPSLLTKIGRWLLRVLRFAEPDVTDPDTLAGQVRAAIEAAMAANNITQVDGSGRRAAAGRSEVEIDRLRDHLLTQNKTGPFDAKHGENWHKTLVRMTRNIGEDELADALELNRPTQEEIEFGKQGLQKSVGSQRHKEYAAMYRAYNDVVDQIADVAFEEDSGRAAVAKQPDRKARTLDEVRSRVAKDYSLTVAPEPMRMINGQPFSSLDPDAVGTGLLIPNADVSMRRMMDESLQEAGVPDDIASTVKVPSSADVDYAFRLTNGSRYWYELSAIGFVKDFFSLSRKLTEHLIDIVAGTSGGQKPTDNLRVAVASMSQDMQGRPVSVGTRDESSLTAALSPATLETHKFGNFSDTMQVLGGLRPGVKPLPTIDLQMAKVFGVQHAAIASDPRMYEAMSRFLIKLRDAQNAMLKNSEQPYESWQIQALLWVAKRDTSDPDSFNIGMPKIVAQLKKAGIPTPGGKITEATLMDPRTSDVLAPTSKIIPEAYTATVETRTKLTKVGRESAEVLEKLKTIDAPWARKLVDEFEKIQRRTMRAIGERQPPKPGNKTRQKSVASYLLSVIMNRSPGSHELSRIDTEGWGTFEGDASPNIRLPLTLGAVGATEKGGGTKRYTPTSDQRQQFLSVLGKHLKQAAQAASQFVPATYGSHDTFSILVRRYDKVGITEAELAEISNSLGRPISYKQVPNGWQLDVNIGGMDETAEQKAENRDLQRIQAVMEKFASNGATGYKVLPRAYDSDYIDGSGYNKHIRSLENEIRRNADTGGSGEGVGDSSQRRASDYATVVEQIKGIAAKQESAFRKWTKEARELGAKRGIQFGDQQEADSGRAAVGQRPESTGDSDRRGRSPGGRYSPLEGAPSKQGATGPDPRLVDVAEQYARDNGIDLKRQAEYVQVDEARAKRIAQAYEDMPHAPDDPAVKEAYEDLIRQTKAQYDALAEAGYTFTFYDGKSDPYAGNPVSAMRDLRQNQTMAVYGTYDGYGTEGITDSAVEGNPMLADTGLRWKDQGGVERPVTANDLFRAVHDAFGHGLEGASFRARGEENAWQAHVRLFTGAAIGAITSETRGQNSWLNYGPYSEKNRTAKVEDTVFAENKIGLMPEWTWTEGRAADYSEGTNEENNDGTEEQGGRASVRRGDEDLRGDSGQNGPTPAPTPRYGKAKEGAVSYIGRHYSPQPRESLDSSKYGAGARGAEGRRLQGADDQRIKSRVYFYIDTDGEIKPEAGVGTFAHETQLDNLYDPASKTVAWDGDFNNFESAVIDAGFDGYIVKSYGMAVLLGPQHTNVPVRRAEEYDAGRAAVGRQTDTPEFKKWFGDSKVVDADGKPLVVYHGTYRSFTEFTQSGARDSGYLGKGFYFTSSAASAEMYSGGLNTPPTPGANIMPVFLGITNPLIIKGSRSQLYEMYPGKSGGALTEAIKKDGYDGVVHQSSSGLTEYVAFDPTQIKSATGNQGTFDPSNPDIRYSAGRKTPADKVAWLREQLAKRKAKPPVDPERTTGTKHAKTDELRAELGFPSRILPTPETFQEWEDEALRRYPDAAARLRVVALAERHPERISKIENAAIGQHLVDLENRREAGEDVLDELLRTVKASTVAGTEAGRDLVSRKVERYSDYSLAGLIKQHLSSVGKDPTKEQMAELIRLASENKALKEENQKLAEKLTQESIARRKAEAAAKPKPVQEKQGTKRATLLKKVAAGFAAFQNAWGGGTSGRAAAGRQSVRYAASQQGPTDPKQIAAEIVSALREAGVSSILELDSQVKENIPNVTPEQMQVFRDAWRESVKETKLESPLGANPDKTDISARAKQLMTLAIEAGYGATPETWMEVVNVVHEQLSTEVPGISESDTMQAMSDYGEWRPLNKEEVAVKTRAIRGKARQSLKIEDALKAIKQSKEWLAAGVSPKEVARRLRENNLLPKATGREQATPDSIERDLIAEFNRLKKDLPISVESNEGQLKSALATAKTAAKNRLDLLKKEIEALKKANKDRVKLVKPVSGKTPLQVDTELADIRKQLAEKREERAKLKAEYETYFPPTKKERLLSAEQQTQRALKAIEKIQKKLEQVKQGLETEKKPDLVEAGVRARLKMWQDRLKAARRAVKEAESARYEGEGGSLSPPIGRKPLTDAQKLAMAERMIASQIEAVKKEVKSLDDGAWVPPTKGASPTSEVKEKLKAELAALKEALKEAREASPEYQARKEAEYWEQYQKSQARRLAFWERRLAEAEAGRLPVPLKKRTITEKTLLENNVKIEHVQYEAMHAIEKARRATWNTGQWIGYGLLEATSLIPKTLMLGLDLSFVSRQGFFYSRSQPIKAFMAAVEAIPAVFSQRIALASMESIESRPNAGEYHLAEIDFTQAHGPKAKMEEMYQSAVVQWLTTTKVKSLLPLRLLATAYSSLERGNRTFSNIMKADLYDIQKRDTLAAREFFNNLESRTGGLIGGANLEWSENDIKQAGRTANIFSGRGTGLKGGSPWLDFFFLARRWAWSRVQADIIVPLQLLTPQGIGQWNADRGMRVALAKLYIQTLLGHATKMAIGYWAYTLLAGDDEEKEPTIEWDLRSSDAWILKMGETRLKDEGGLMPVFVLASRLLTGEVKTGDGRIKSIYGENVEWGGKNAADYIISFARYKAGTGPSAILEWFAGSDAIGKPLSKTEIITSRLSPLGTREIIAAEKELGVAQGTLASLEAFFGASVSTYGDRTEYRNASPEERKEIVAKDIESVKWDSPDPKYKEFLSQPEIKAFQAQREKSQQGLIERALVIPKREPNQTDESYNKELVRQAKAFQEVQEAGWTPAEIRQLFLKGKKRSDRGGVYDYSPEVKAKLRMIPRRFGSQ